MAGICTSHILFYLQMSLLSYKNVALQAKLEEQTVHTEQLEYELTKARKKHKHDQSYSEQREAQDVKQLDDMKGLLCYYCIRITAAGFKCFIK